MSEFMVTVTMRYRVKAATKKEAESAVSQRVHAPMDEPPGELTNYKVSAKEVGT